MQKTMFAYIVHRQQPTFKFVATNVRRTFARLATGATSIKPIMRYGCVIDVMPFIVGDATKWINVMIVGKSFVLRAQRSCRANFVAGDYAKIALRRVAGTFQKSSGGILMSNGCYSAISISWMLLQCCVESNDEWTVSFCVKIMCLVYLIVQAIRYDSHAFSMTDVVLFCVVGTPNLQLTAIRVD